MLSMAVDGNSIPLDCLLCVLIRLPLITRLKAKEVSREWYDGISLLDTLQRDLILWSPGTKESYIYSLFTTAFQNSLLKLKLLDVAAVSRLSRTFPNVRNILLYELDGDGFHNLTKAYPGLNQIDVYYQKGSSINQIITSITTYCRQLSSLKLVDLETGDWLKLENLVKLTRNCTKLNSFHLHLNHQFQFDLAALEDCRNLTELVLANCQLKNYASFRRFCKLRGHQIRSLSVKLTRNFNGRVIEEIVRGMPHLTSLSLDNYAVEGGLITQSNFLKLCHLTKLVRLEFNFNFSFLQTIFTKDLFLKLTKSCSSVRHFKIDNYYVLTASSLKHMAEHWNKLESLSLYLLTTEDWILSLARFPKLKFLDLGVMYVTPNLLESFAKCPSLEILHVMCFNEMDNGSLNAVVSQAKVFQNQFSLFLNDTMDSRRFIARKSLYPNMKTLTFYRSTARSWSATKYCFLKEEVMLK